jgi:ATP-binding cassette subfamily C protein
MELVKKLLDLLTYEERRNLYLLFVAVLVMAGLEVASVASIMPFLSVASDPSSIENNDYLRWAFEAFGFQEPNAFLIALGVVALIALVLSNSFIIFVTWLQHRFVENRNHSVAKRLLQCYLQRPYEYFLTRNSSDLSKNILEETREVTTSMLRPVLNGLARGIVALAIIGFLVAVSPMVALLVAAVLGGAYTGIYALVRAKLDDFGEQRVRANQGRYQSVNEVFGGIKEVKLRGKEDVFLGQFDRPAREYALYRTMSKVINKAPRYILEMVAFGGIILIAVYLIALERNMQQVIPVLGLYAFAGYRLMPALQNAFKGLAKARFNKAALETLHTDLHGARADRCEPNGYVSAEHQETDATVDRLELSDQLVFDDVTFRYPESEEPAIRNLSLTIDANTTVGFVGETGSGKTTTVDLLLGLLQPDCGEIRIDGTTLAPDVLRAWQTTVGYVPQDIYLSDDTIANNVAFGVPDQDIDQDRVQEAMKRAQIYEFVSTRMPYGMQTVVGERGVKLSGGQKQRIGIARALYHSPSVLVFDEATSALDQVTEQRVMEAIRGLARDHTIVLIAHRLSTVENADRVFMLEDGQLVGAGAYDNLLKTNEHFRRMAQA